MASEVRAWQAAAQGCQETSYFTPARTVEQHLLVDKAGPPDESSLHRRVTYIMGGSAPAAANKAQAWPVGEAVTRGQATQKRSLGKEMAAPQRPERPGRTRQCRRVKLDPRHNKNRPAPALRAPTPARHSRPRSALTNISGKQQHQPAHPGQSVGPKAIEHRPQLMHTHALGTGHRQSGNDDDWETSTGPAARSDEYDHTPLLSNKRGSIKTKHSEDSLQRLVVLLLIYL